jgi:thiosulfate/3-mercaptopyruvate sulfurtransferase
MDGSQTDDQAGLSVVARSLGTDALRCGFIGLPIERRKAIRKERSAKSISKWSKPMPETAASDFFVASDWLAEHLGAPDLVVVDGTFIMPDEKRNAHDEYLAGHIPGAVFFDIDAIADHTTDLPHMLPTPAAFAAAMRELGISDRARIVVYDSTGREGLARVWWTLRIFGARDVKILTGGLRKWQAEGRALEQGLVKRAPQDFTVRFDAAAVVTADDVAHAMQTGSAQIIDARAAARFAGTVPEPRPGLRSGHIPGSFNLPWREVVDDGVLRNSQDVSAAFVRAGVDPNKPIITTCGSGVTAAILLLALATTGKTDVRLYDGSWSEWGGRRDLPVATR